MTFLLILLALFALVELLNLALFLARAVSFGWRNAVAHVELDLTTAVLVAALTLMAVSQ